MNKQSLEPSSKTKELRPIGVSSELPARLQGPRGLIGYLRDHLFLLLNGFISFFSFIFKLGNSSEV